LTDAKQYNEHILIRAARNSEENDRIAEAIKLYNLAGDYGTVVGCLATALGNTIAQSGPDEKARTIERTAAEILRHYERTNRAVGKNRDAVVKLLKIREAIEAKANGKPEVALEVLESAQDLVPLSGDVAKITKRAEEFKDLHESVQRNLQVYLPLAMDALAGVHQKVKSTMVADATRQMVSVCACVHLGIWCLMVLWFIRRLLRFGKSRGR
jgi:nuclear pore complex protein Nup93